MDTQTRQGSARVRQSSLAAQDATTCGDVLSAGASEHT
jgi:hypothetical protein